MAVDRILHLFSEQNESHKNKNVFAQVCANMRSLHNKVYI